MPSRNAPMQANEALHHQHQVAQNSLLPLLNAGAEPIDQKPILPIQMDQKPPVSAAELLKDNVASGGGGRHGPMPVVKKEHKSKTPFICGYCNKAFRDSYHLRRHESCHTGIKMVSRPKKTAQTAPTMVPMVSSMGGMIRENTGNPSYISTMAGLLTTATTSTVSSGSSIMTPSSMGNMQHGNVAVKKPSKPVKKNHGCEMCGKAFRDVYHLNRHKLSHSDEKPFECPICHQRFKRKDRMTYHARSHDGGVHKPYVCSVCGKGFSRKDPRPSSTERSGSASFGVFPSPIVAAGKLHAWVPDVGSVREKCEQAAGQAGSVSVSPPDHLSCHVKHVHSSERPFKCQVTACTSAFATKDRLRSHMIRHEGKVTCSICGKMLSAAYITSHLKTHGQTNFNSCNKATPVSVSAAITSAMNRGGGNNPVTIAAQMNISTNTVSLHHPVTMVTGPVNIASVNIPSSGSMNIAHPVAITTPMPMNIAGPLNIAMRSMESMPFLSQVLPSSPPW
ncbi:Vascular endothelial zinc finger 1 [Merluccius polli]|uniref:Myc-associated zinc finger protein n=1 Tax=Merluccius polli TaxID=89951 RepID=A0AA47MFU9_MERPO|nr:Vascular endothelial zinc finger 1 [Merluccius polli]